MALLPAALAYEQTKGKREQDSRGRIAHAKEKRSRSVAVIDPYIYLLPCTNCIFPVVQSCCKTLVLTLLFVSIAVKNEIPA